MASKTSANRQRNASVNRHWTYQYDNDTEQYQVYNSDGVMIAAVTEEKDAILITNAVNEYISSQRTFGTPNVGIPRHSTLVRSIVDSIRRSRQRFDDRALEGISVYCNYGSCLVHTREDCPPFDPTDIGMKNNTCQFVAESFQISLPNSVKYHGNLELISDKES